MLSVRQGNVVLRMPFRWDCRLELKEFGFSWTPGNIHGSPAPWQVLGAVAGGERPWRIPLTEAASQQGV